MTMRMIPTLAIIAGLQIGAHAQSPCDSLQACFQWSGLNSTVEFQNCSQGGTTPHYLWDFGDGITSDSPSPVHHFSGPGTYTVCLTMGEPNMPDTCKSTLCQVVTVDGGDPCENLNAGFQVTTDGPAATFHSSGSTAQYYEWSFGDGTSGYGPMPTHTYAGPGTYTACLLVWAWDPQTQDTCYADHCETVVITGGDPCDSLSACFDPIELPGGGYYFENCTGLHPGSQFFWDFGDGHGSNGLHAEHHYDQPGSYTVCLIAEWLNCIDTTCTTIVVSGDSLCDGLAVTMSWNQGSNNSVLFSGTANFAPDGYLWDYGDGEHGYDQTVTHTYDPGTYTACFSAYLWNEQTQDTCWAQTCQTVVVQGGEPCDSLNACFIPSSPNNGVYFFYNCTNPPDGTVFEWDFGDGHGTIGTNADHFYDQPGTYTVCLLATWENCADSTCTTITVEGNGSPCDSLNADFEHSTAGLAVNFANAVIDNSWTYSWDFGDGTSGQGPNPYHTYDQSGTYTVCLGIWAWNPQDQDSCFVNHCETITITGDDLCDDLAVTMSWNQGSNNNVLFTGTANFAPDGYLWDYGDGEHGYDQTVTHTYDPGTYTACFSAYLWNEQTQDTCWAHACQTVTITGGNPCDNLNAGFQVTTVGPVATFHSSNSTAQQYEWHFGDGTNGYGPMPVHTYAEPGTYTACLLVWAWNPQTQDSCFADHCETVVIAGGDPCDSLSACFEPIELPGGGYYFENCTGMLPGSQFFWDFGDGHGSNGLHAEHHYDQPGTYTVCLIAEWQNCIDTTCTLITVGATDPCAGLQAGFTWHTTPNGTLFSNSTTGTGFQTTFVWTFGDGSTSNDAQPFHTYAADGVYEACLQVISIFELPGGGVTTCVDDTCMTVVIGEPSPCDSLNAGFTASGGPGGVNFANAVIDPSWTYQWYFGDGTEGYGPNPYHTFPDAGTYQVCLVVSAWDPVAQDSCFANHCEMVVITGGNPCDNLNAGFQVTTDGPIATFHSSNSTDQQYEWHFGDGTIGYGPMPSHIYAGPGTYTACLLVWAWDPQTQDTCYADHCETVVILPTGLTEADARNDGISTWPQPFSNELTLSGDGLDGSYWITLLDMAGRIADDRQLTINGTVQLDYRAIPPGSYILRLQGASSVRTVRVLKY